MSPPITLLSRMTRSSSGMMTAQELTGAPLISLVPCKSRKLRRAAPGLNMGAIEHKMSEPLHHDRQRHGSETRSSYYLGQNLYQKRNVRRGHSTSSSLYLQDFYKNPGFGDSGQFRSLEGAGMGPGYIGHDLQSR